MGRNKLREAILCSFSELPKQHQKFDEPIFVFSHILIPHPPNLFGPEGEPVSSVRPEGLESWDYKEGYINNLKFANKNIKQIVDELLTDLENPPIIIIQADHGSQFDFDPSNISNEYLEQITSIFSAYYLPGMEKKFYQLMLSRLFNTFSYNIQFLL